MYPVEVAGLGYRAVNAICRKGTIAFYVLSVQFAVKW